MKRSKQNTASTRLAIIERASQEFREKGLQLSVADLMKAVGLTHGGFYRHFETKEDLIAEATRHALRTLIGTLTQVAQNEKDKKIGLKKLIERYLSLEHRSGIAEGCIVTALGSELTRSNESIRHIVAEESGKLVGVIANQLEIQDESKSLATAQFIASAMTGLLTMSRLMPDAEADKLLAHARLELIDKYCR